MKRVTLFLAAAASIAAFQPGTAHAALNCNEKGTWQAAVQCLNQRANFQLTMIQGLQGRVRALESSTTVAGLSSRIATLEGQVSSLNGRMSTAEGRLDNLAASNQAQGVKLNCIAPRPIWQRYTYNYYGDYFQYLNVTDSYGNGSVDGPWRLLQERQTDQCVGIFS